MEGRKIDLKERHPDNLMRRRKFPEEEKYHSKSSHYHSYTFRFDKPYKKYSTKDQNILNIKTLELPEDAPTFKAGTSLERWSQKPPRLKSSKRHGEPKHEGGNDDVEEEDCEIEEMYFNHAYKAEAAKEEVKEEEAVDPDVQRLILEAANYNSDDEDINNYYKKNHKKSRHKQDTEKKPKKPKRKKLTFDLSKPASPETVQVIRVDVTSSYDFNEENVSTDGEDYCERFQGILTGRDDGDGDGAQEEKLSGAGGAKEEKCDFTLVCKKVTLLPRDEIRQ